MTFLELCQRLRQEVGAAGNGPANVASQSGEYARLVDWIATVWEELQMERHWAFDWATGSVELNTADTQYTLPADFDAWIEDTLKHDGDRIHVVTWPDLPEGGTFTTVSIAPDRVLHLNAAPSVSGSLTFEYFRTPQKLVNNTDVPRMPERFHMLLVYRAMMEYALYENAQEVMQRAGRNIVRLENRLMHAQLPTVNLPESLA